MADFLPSKPGRARGFTVELPAQGEPGIGRELIRVCYDDGATEELRLHDYERIYALPGVYEQIVQDRLGCRSPAEIAALLGDAVDRLGWGRGEARVLDVAAGNGVSGEALAAEGLHPVLGTDIVATARQAALRDRPHVYDAYLTLDLLDVPAPQRAAIAARRCNVLSCVAPVGDDPSQVPPRALLAAAGMLEPDALVAYLRDPAFATPDPVTASWWEAGVGPGSDTQLLARRRYLHRYTVTGRPLEMDGVVWRIRRRPTTRLWKT